MIIPNSYSKLQASRPNSPMAAGGIIIHFTQFFFFYYFHDKKKPYMEEN